MNAGTGKLTTKAIAVIVVVAMLDAVGFPPVLMVLMTGTVFVVWLFSRRAQAREVERIFEFYVAADAILREEERCWYGFEIAEVIENGEGLFDLMPDPPPLNYYVLAALYQRLGNHTATVEYLTRLNQGHLCDETHRMAPSAQLRHYVKALRRMEQQPSIAPQSLAAVRSLERARQRNAAKMLFESSAQVPSEPATLAEESCEHERSTAEVSKPREEIHFESSLPISARPPISAVLHDVYNEENRAG